MDEQRKKNQAGRRYLSFLLMTSLLCTACLPERAVATTMRLTYTEGQVNISDSSGKDVEVKEELGLYGGYGVDTLSESYAWINLDKVKLTKMDQDSAIEIQKSGKHLKIMVNEGKLFFYVTEPLKDNETLNIRTSSMIVGIRGTCGWVEVTEDEETANVFLLEGKVHCEAQADSETETETKEENKANAISQRFRDALSIKSPSEEKNGGENSSFSQMFEDTLLNKLHREKTSQNEEDDDQHTVHAGEMATVTKDGKITVSKYEAQDIPNFVWEEIGKDKDLLEKIDEASDLDVLNHLPESLNMTNLSGAGNGEDSAETSDVQNPPEVNEALEQYRDVIRHASHYTFGPIRIDGHSGYTDNYQYALVQMTRGDTVPTLLLSREIQGGMHNVRVFQYDPESKVIYEPADILFEGAAQADGLRVNLSMAADGNGLYRLEMYNKSRTFYNYRVTFVKYSPPIASLNIILESTGLMENLNNDQGNGVIEWHDVQDIDYLERWSADTDTASGKSGSPTSSLETDTVQADETLTEKTEVTEAETLPEETEVTEAETLPEETEATEAEILPPETETNAYETKAGNRPYTKNEATEAMLTDETGEL